MTINWENSELELDFHAGEKLTSSLTRAAGLFAALELADTCLALNGHRHGGVDRAWGIRGTPGPTSVLKWALIGRGLRLGPLGRATRPERKSAPTCAHWR